MPNGPGTVSEILWHFTGGPRWNKNLNRQDAELKPPDEAYAALSSILASCELRLGQYKEVAHVMRPSTWKVNPTTNKIIGSNFAKTTLESVPVCCLAEIPVEHLSYHAKRYGKIGIGFHRDAAIRCGFNPVFYQLHTSDVLQNIYAGFAALKKMALCDLESVTAGLRSKLERLPNMGHDLDDKLWSTFYEVEGHANVASSAMPDADRSFQIFLAFVKTFEKKEFTTIYCEREWRSIQPFKFNLDDIFTIVLPRDSGDGGHFERFIKERASITIPPTVYVSAWDELVT